MVNCKVTKAIISFVKIKHSLRIFAIWCGGQVGLRVGFTFKMKWLTGRYKILYRDNGKWHLRSIKEERIGAA